ncbi:heat shock 70 kDa protein 12B-like [Magallana gigas]|uniref:heat shock 70 kDa protein 12B-like n=1 Tax=Magallana gigas TaxID=29159 RepID=UPI003340C063
MIYNKTSTCILFTKEKEFSEFGFDAEAKYLDLLHDVDNTSGKAKDWYVFRRFKMALYELQSEDQEVLIEDETGKSLPAMVVFSESLSYLKQSVIDCVSKQLIGIELTDIKWIVTVPAIWSDPAKAFMRKAALEAGIYSKMLTIVLEPEAAATFVKHLPVERRVDGQEGDVFKTFAPGTKYIVVDAGG